MSRVFDASHYLHVDNENCGITAWPFTMLCWIKTTNAQNKGLIVRYNTTTTRYASAEHNNTKTLQAREAQSGSQIAATTGTRTDSTWTPVIVLFDTNYTRVVAINSTLAAAQSAGNDNLVTTATSTYGTNSSPSLFIGAYSGGGSPFSGSIGHVALWKSKLSDADLNSLLGGANPLAIDATNLTRYWSFTDGSLVDAVTGTVTLTDTGTTHNDSDNPTVNSPPGGFTPGPGTTPKEGRTLIANLVYKNADANRGTSLQLGLLTNSTVLDENTTLDQITEPTSANGYVRITLTDANWTVSVPDVTYALQQFTASGGSFSAPIYGWFICTTGTAPKLLHFQQSNGAPYTITDGTSVNVPLDTTI